MKISNLPYRLVDFRDEESMRKWFQFVSDAGMEGVEIMYNRPVDWYLIERIRKLLAEFPLSASALVIHNNFCRFTPEEQREERKLFEGYVAMAEAFETNIIRVLAGNWDRRWPEISRAKAVQAVVATVAQCLELAEPKGMLLVMENHPGMGVDKDIVRELFEKIDSPYFGWNFDSENAYRVEGQTAFDFLDDPVILKRLAYVHAKDFVDAPDGWLPAALGDGDLDLVGMLKRIKQSDYQGWLSFEYAGSEWNDVKRSADFLRETWEKI